MRKLIEISVGILLIVIIHSCKNDAKPAITTSEITNITATSARGGGNLTNKGNCDIAWKGLCWSSSTTPTNEMYPQTREGSDSGIFTSTITGLEANTTYYVRAFVLYTSGGSWNNPGIYTAYGNQITFKTSPSGQK